MTGWNGAAALAVLAALGVTPAQAADSVTGRWAAEASACTEFGGNAERAPLVVSMNAVRWQDDSCRIARSYKTGDTVHIQALCRSHGGLRSIPVSLRRHGRLLDVRWDRAALGTLRRCP